MVSPGCGLRRCEPNIFMGTRWTCLPIAHSGEAVADLFFPERPGNLVRIRAEAGPSLVANRDWNAPPRPPVKHGEERKGACSEVGGIVFRNNDQASPDQIRSDHTRAVRRERKHPCIGRAGSECPLSRLSPGRYVGWGDRARLKPFPCLNHRADLEMFNDDNDYMYPHQQFEHWASGERMSSNTAVDFHID